MLSCIGLAGAVLQHHVRGGFDADLFLAFMDELVLVLPQHSTVVMDNCRIRLCSFQSVSIIAWSGFCVPICRQLNNPFGNNRVVGGFLVPPVQPKPDSQCSKEEVDRRNSVRMVLQAFQEAKVDVFLHDGTILGYVRDLGVPSKDRP